MSLLDGPGHYGHSPVPYTILGALKSCGPTTASSSSMVNMGLLGEVKHRNTEIIVCTCVLQCIGVDVYTELPSILYIRCQGHVHFTQTYIDTVYYDHLCCIVDAQAIQGTGGKCLSTLLIFQHFSGNE